MMPEKPRLFSTPEVGPLGPLQNDEDNTSILLRSRIPWTREDWEACLDDMSPARHLLRDEITIALEKYCFNQVGPVYFPHTHPEMRDHFLPHTGLWLDRPFKDPRVATQIWMHTAFHEWFGWPLPVSTLYPWYEQAMHAAEVLATMESEYRFFQRFPSETEGMFDPAYPSTYQAFTAVGADTVAKATAWALHAQASGGSFPDEVYAHPAYRNGVAVTLLRQGAWAEHDSAYTMAHWTYQRDIPGLLHAYTTLWNPDRHHTIRHRREAGVRALLAWSATHDYDEGAHQEAVMRSANRILALEAVDQGRGLPTPLRTLTEAYDKASMCGAKPMPLWGLALQFAKYRRAWEARLREKTEVWSDVCHRSPT